MRRPGELIRSAVLAGGLIMGAGVEGSASAAPDSDAEQVSSLDDLDDLGARPEGFDEVEEDRKPQEPDVMDKTMREEIPAVPLLARETQNPDYKKLIFQKKEEMLKKKFNNRPEGVEKYFDHLDAKLKDRIEKVVEKELQKVNEKLPPELRIQPSEFLALIAVESNFNPHIISPQGYYGLCQLSLEAASAVGIHTKDPKGLLGIELNIKGGVALYSNAIKLFGSKDLAFMAFKGGSKDIEDKLGRLYQSLRPGKGHKFDSELCKKMAADGSISLPEMYKLSSVKKMNTSEINYTLQIRVWEEWVREYWTSHL